MVIHLNYKQINKIGINIKFTIIDKDTISEENFVSILAKTEKVKMFAPTGEAVIYTIVFLDNSSNGRIFIKNNPNIRPIPIFNPTTKELTFIFFNVGVKYKPKPNIIEGPTKLPIWFNVVSKKLGTTNPVCPTTIPISIANIGGVFSDLIISLVSNLKNIE